jgi:hypothetical protein
MKWRNMMRDCEIQWLTLTGKTRHGKNRINQHGIHWLVLADGMFDGREAWLLRSINRTDKGGFDGRWVHKNGDNNFIVKGLNKETGAMVCL